MQEIKLVNFEYYICIVDQYVGKENGTIVARIMNQYLLYVYMYMCVWKSISLDASMKI